MDPKTLWGLVKDAVSEWSEDKVPRLGAALAFYSVLSLAPLLLIAIAIAGLAFGAEAARGQLVGQIRGLVGPEGGLAIEAMLANAPKHGAGAVATAVGLATLLYGASGVFGQLQDALNTIWEVQPGPGRGVWGFIKDRFLSFSMVLGTGFLLMVSLVLSTALAAAGKLFGGFVPLWAPALQAVDLAVTFGVITLLFAMIYKYLPDAHIAWGDVWLGSVSTAALFLVGKFAIGLYLGRSGLGSAYGAAGSFVVLLVWINYSAQILFFGAEFTQVYAIHRGSRIAPARGAEPVSERARAQQGIPRADAPAPGPVVALKTRYEVSVRPPVRVDAASPAPAGPGPRPRPQPQPSSLAAKGVAVAVASLVLLSARAYFASEDD